MKKVPEHHFEAFGEETPGGGGGGALSIVGNTGMCRGNALVFDYFTLKMPLIVVRLLSKCPWTPQDYFLVGYLTMVVVVVSQNNGT